MQISSRVSERCNTTTCLRLLITREFTMINAIHIPAYTPPFVNIRMLNEFGYAAIEIK